MRNVDMNCQPKEKKLGNSQESCKTNEKNIHWVLRNFYVCYGKLMKQFASLY